MFKERIALFEGIAKQESKYDMLQVLIIHKPFV